MRRTDRGTASDQQTDRHTETQTRASLFHKHTVRAQSRGTRHGKCLHRSIGSTKHEQTNFPLEPLQPSALSRILWLPRVFLCMQIGRCEKASPITLLLSLLGVARLPFAPSGPFSIFKTRQISSDRKHYDTKQRHEASLRDRRPFTSDVYSRTSRFIQSIMLSLNDEVPVQPSIGCDILHATLNRFWSISDSYSHRN